MGLATMDEVSAPSTILVVDDQEMVRRLLELRLTKAGFQVILAADGQEALERFNAESPDLVVLDLMLPVLDGFEVCQRIRKHSLVPIVMLSGRRPCLNTCRSSSGSRDGSSSSPACRGGLGGWVMVGGWWGSGGSRGRGRAVGAAGAGQETIAAVAGWAGGRPRHAAAPAPQGRGGLPPACSTPGGAAQYSAVAQRRRRAGRAPTPSSSTGCPN